MDVKGEKDQDEIEGRGHSELGKGNEKYGAVVSLCHGDALQRPTFLHDRKVIE
jgi:hypothetical protein